MSISDLNEVAQCCQAIQTDKKGVKKALDKLGCLLKNSNVVKALNANTDESDEVVNWNTVFSPLLEHLFKDEEALVKVLPAGGANLKKNLAKYKSTCEIVKNILQIANKTGPRINICDFLNYALSVLKKTRLCHEVGSVFLKIIAEDVFCHRKYVCQLSLRQYSDLLEACFHGAQDEAMKNHLYSISTMLCLIINSIRMQQDPGDFIDLFERFTSLLNNMSSNTCKSSPYVLENVMKSMISFLEWSSVSFRMRSCELGESCLDNLLSLWLATGHTLTEVSIEQIMKFSSMQIQLHNPDGKTDSSKGAFSSNSEKWTRILLKMLSACEIHLKKFANRLKYASKSGKSANFNACLELSAEVCCVLFKLRVSNTLGVSKSNECDGISTAVESNTEYLSGKIDFCEVSSILSNLPRDGRSAYILQLYAWMYEAWLQILLRLLPKIADSISPYTIDDLSSELCKIYQMSHKTEIINVTVDCVSALFEIRSEQYSDAEAPSSGRDLVESWRTWWTIGNSFLSHGSKQDVLHHAFRLLKSLVRFDKASSKKMIYKTGCMKNTRSLWTTLFTHVAPSSDSLQFVTAYVEAYGSAHNYADDEVFMSMLKNHYHHHSNKEFVKNTIKRKYPFFSFILHWLFGCKDEIVIDTDEVANHDRCCGSGCPSDVANSIAKLNIFSLDEGVSKSLSAELPTIYELVYFLLLLCQRKIPSDEETEQDQKIHFPVPLRLHTIDPPEISMWFDLKYVGLVQYFQIAADDVLPDKHKKLHFVHEIAHLVSAFMLYNVESVVFEIEEKGNEYNSSKIVELIRRCFFVANVHGRFRFFYYLLFEYFTYSAHFQSGFEKASLAIERYCESQREKLVPNDNVVDSFPDLFFQITDSIKTLCHYPRNHSQSNLPKLSEDYRKALDTFGEIATSYVKSFLKRTGKKEEESGGNTGGFSGSGDNDFQCTQEAEPGLKRRRYSGIGSLSTSDKDNRGTVTPAAIDGKNCDCGSDPHHFLCNANLALSNAIDYISFISIQHKVKDHLVNCITVLVDLCDTTNPSHLQVFYSLLRKVSDACHELDSAAISQVTELLKSVFKNCYRDQEVCSEFLLLLSTLLTNVTEKECPEDMKTLLISTATKIITVYWKLSLQNKCAPRVRAAIVHCLFAIFMARLQSGVPFDPARAVQCCTRLKLLDFSLNSDLLAGMLSFLNDRHVGVQLLCAGIVKELISEKRISEMAKKCEELSKKCDKSSQNCNNSSSADKDDLIDRRQQNETHKWRQMQQTVIACVAEFVKVFFKQKATPLDGHESVVQMSPLDDAERYISTLSAFLHAVSNSIPYSGHQTEKKALKVLCLLASLGCNNAPAQCLVTVKKLLCFCVDRISSNSARTGFDLENKGHQHNASVRYLEVHLRSIFGDWFKDRPKDVEQAITEFPYMLFKCINLEDFCNRYKGDLFPFLFCNARDMEELKLIISSSFVCDMSNISAVKAKLKDMVKSSAADIISLMLAMTRDKNGSLAELRKKCLMLDSIMGTENTIHRLCQIHYSEIAASIFLQAENFDSSGITTADNDSLVFDQLIRHLHNWYCNQDGPMAENMAKIPPAQKCIPSVLFADGRTFQKLMQIVLCFRRYLIESKNIFDLCKALRILQKFLHTILYPAGSHRMTAIWGTYLFRSIVQLVSYYVSFLCCKKEDVLPQYCNRSTLHSCLLACIETLRNTIEICHCAIFHHSTKENWATVVPFMNTVATMILQIEKEKKDYIGRYVKKRKPTSLVNVDSNLESLCMRIESKFAKDLYLFLPFPDTYRSPRNKKKVDLSLCLEIFEIFVNSMKSFDVHDHNQLILSSVIKKLANSLKSTIFSSKDAPGDSKSLDPEDARSTLRMLFKLSASKNFNTDEVASCISHLCSIMSTESISVEADEIPEVKEDFMSIMFRILTDQISDYNPVYSSEAIQCLYQLCALPLFNQYCEDHISGNASYLNLFSPFSVTFKNNPKCKILTQSSQRTIANPVSDCYTRYETWICGLASRLCELCDNRMFVILQPICQRSSSLCEVLLPYIFHDMLKNDVTGKQHTNLSHYVSDIFDSAISGFDAGKSPNVLSLQRVLHVVQFLRRQSRPSMTWERAKRAKKEATTSWDNNFWLNLNYLHAAEIAVHCKQPFMAILFAEIWINSRQNEDSKISGSALSNIGSNEASKLKEILLESYTAINETDSLHGLCSSSLVDDDIMAAIYKKEDSWNELVYLYNAKASRESTVSGELLRALHFSGLEHIGATYRKALLSDVNLRGGVESNGDLERNKWLAEVQYEAAWKAGQWGDDPSKQFTHWDKESGFHEKVFNCLAGISTFHSFVGRHLTLLRKQIISSLQDNLNHLHLDHCIQPDLAKLMALEQIKSMHETISQNDPDTIITDMDALLKSWKKIPLEKNSLFNGRYECSELLLSVRDSLMSALIKSRTLAVVTTDRQETPELQSELLIESEQFKVTLEGFTRNQEEILEMQSQLLIESKQYKVASQVNSKLKSRLLSRCDSDHNAHYTFMKISMDEARVQWLSGNQSQALLMVKGICEKLSTMNRQNKHQMTYLYAKALHTQGQWLHESKMEGPSAIMENYLSKAVDIAEKLGKDPLVSSLCKEGFESLAKFADLQYQEVIHYMKSSEFERKRLLVREAQAELEIAQKNSSAPGNKYKHMLKKNFEIDECDFTNILHRKEGFLKSALKSYVKCLNVCDSNELLMYRVCSLWFANANNDMVCKLMEGACKSIGSHNFVHSAYQLAARLTSNASESRFQTLLMKLLCRVAKDHPYHVLDIILALVNAHKDEEYIPGKSGKAQGLNVEASGRVEAAKKVWNEVKKSKKKLMCCMEFVYSSYIQLANHQVNPKEKPIGIKIQIPRSLHIQKLCKYAYDDPNEFEEVPIPTVRVPIDKGCRYEKGVVTLRSFLPFFKLCGGINVPKILIAEGSDGLEHKHLLKGKDDLRQDAVMEQVFQVVNTLLHKERDSQDLRMRTYKVVPLSQHSGLVEWCENTIPIGTYLTGTPPQDCGAHHRFRPQDWLTTECRKKLGSTGRETFQKKRAVYKEICAKFRPVLKHFFYENFLDPTNWFKRKLAYSKSVATSSMVGYVLGLGDRHVQNILLDSATAELIHIDLGVAFEQGHCLPTPERVPFRLTRDIVDGFGVTGVEGTFRRNCERTLTLIRNSSEIISTIIEVLLHDPLHDWMMTPKKVMTLQRPSETNQESVCSSIMNVSTAAELMEETTVVHTATKTNRSSLAERALLRVQEKLRGLEFSTVLSVKGQVNLLIQQATDPEKLCLMFAGWQPYL